MDDDTWDASMEAAVAAAEAAALERRARPVEAVLRPAPVARGVFADDTAPLPPARPVVLAPVFAMAAAGRPVATGVFAGPLPPRAATHPPSGAGAGPWAPTYGRPVHDGMPLHPPAPATAPATAHAFAPTLAYVAPPPPPPPATAAFTVGPGGDVDVEASFDDAVRSALASVGARWVPVDRVWRLPLARLADADAAVRACGVPVAIEPLPDVASRLLRCAAGAPDDSDRYASIPPRLEAALMPFQRDGVRFVLAKGGRALIGDEMGLGKTVQAIAVAAAYRSEWPALIVAPSSLRDAWADALGEWLGVRGERVLVVNSAKDGARIAAGPAPAHDFVVASYALVGKLRPVLEAARFRVVILDESHYIKDAKACARGEGVGAGTGAAAAAPCLHSRIRKRPAPPSRQSQRTKDTVPLAQRATRCLLLSGTPALARPKELFQQLAALLPAAKLRMRDFGERYCKAPPSRFGGVYDGAINLNELNRVLCAAAMVRRLKADVLTQLPPKRRQQVFLTLGAAEKKELGTLAAGLETARRAHAAAVERGGDPGSLQGEERRAVMDAYHKTAQIKCAAVQKYVEELLLSGDKFLIFAHHKELLDAISFTLNKARVKFVRIDGSVASSKRQGLVGDFQAGGDVRAAVLSITAAGTGLTLTGASVVVFAELAWTPGSIVQAEDRAHRIGQSRAVNVYYLHVKGSVDDTIWSTLANKLDAVGQAVDGRADALGVEKAANAGGGAAPGAGALQRCLAAAAAKAGGGTGAASTRALDEYADDDGCSSPVRGAGVENAAPADKRARWA